jgi:hypothetical protein
MSPEYAMQGLFSDKSDVFSFGVLLLEIISGRRNTSFYDCENYLTLLGFVSLLNSYLTQSLMCSASFLNVCFLNIGVDTMDRRQYFISHRSRNI